MRKLGTFVLFILFLNIFLFHPVGPGSFVLFCLGLFIFLLGIYNERKIHISTFLGLGAFFILASYGVIGRGNGFVNFIESVSILCLLILTTYLLSTHIPFVRSLMEIILVPLHMLVSYIKAGIDTLRFIVSDEWKTKAKGFTVSQEKLSLGKSIIIGLLIGIPIVFVLVSLLSSDPVFGTFIKNTGNIIYKMIPLKNLNQVFIRVAYNTFFIALFLPLLFLRRDKNFISPVSFLEKYNLTREITVVMTLVALTLGVFLLVQWPYIFINVPKEIDLSAYSVKTYSEYVRRGFTELLFVSLFVYSILWAGLISFRKNTILKSRILFVVQMVVLGEFFLFLLSIFRRIALYQEYHGWSLVRIYGGIFLLWVTAIATTLFLRHFTKKRFVIAEVMTTGTLLLFFAFFNAENFIVTTHPPTVNKRIDYVYLSRMSADGYQGWKKAYGYSQNVLNDRNLDKETIINRDKRREIAYASIITGSLTKKYHLLINDYGTEKELRSYYKKILLVLQKQNEQMTSQIQPQIENVTPTPSSASIYSTNQKENEENRMRIEKYLQKIDNPKTPIEEIASQIYVDGGYFYLSYDPNSWPFNYYFLLPPNERMDSQYKPKSTLDRVFIWNHSKETAFRNMQKDMPIEELIKLQEGSHKLYQKISHQPENEREYETDISFDTPFLEPL